MCAARSLTIRDQRGVRELIGSVADALKMPAAAWLPSVLGVPSSWCPARYSDYDLLWSGNLRRLVHYLIDICVPSIPGRAPRWVPRPLAKLFWHYTRTERHPDQDGHFYSFPAEAWFFS